MIGLQQARRLFDRLADRREERRAESLGRGVPGMRSWDGSVEGPSTLAFPDTELASGTWLHWGPSGTFPLQALGEAYHRDAIRSFAGNEPGTSALVFCTATLVPDPADTYHRDAVAVWIGGSRVAHLMRPDARGFRERLAAAGIALQPTTCDALITGGDVSDGAQRPYVIELDVRLADPPPVESTPTYVAPLRLPSAPAVTRDRDGGYTIRVPYLSLSAMEHCAVGCRLRLWTREGTDTLVLLEPTSVAGSGRVAVLKKADVPELAADPGRAEAIVRQLGVRSCVIDCSVPVAELGSVATTSDEGAALV